MLNCNINKMAVVQRCQPEQPPKSEDIITRKAMLPFPARKGLTDSQRGCVKSEAHNIILTDSHALQCTSPFFEKNVAFLDIST